ncbi:MAG: alpha-2-macroglobulin family protein, partial [Flavitalea sp.]
TSTSSKFDPSTDALGLLTLNVSSLAWISKDNTYFVVNRESGAPVAAANVQVYYPKYDNTVRSYVDTKGPVKTTDKNGQFLLEASSKNNSRNLKLEITSGKDTLSDDEQIYVYYTPRRAPVNKEKNTIYLFSDRSIYRPGQTIWFKGIVVNNASKKVAENFSTTISLYDANNQLVDTLKLKTNEYGSVKGQFLLPANLLNGSFSLREKTTNAHFSFNVEEYKRPKFEAAISPLTGTYAVNDTVKISGSATAYTGNGLNDAKVKYRVVRQSVYPLWGFGGGYKRTIWPPRPQNDMMITSGETVTKADGSFDISFKAIPDATMNKKNQPVFTYNVTADITDLTGETRSVSQSVSVGYHSLQLSLDVPESLPADSLKTQLKAFSTNLNGLYQRADVTVSMEKLKTPATAFRTKLWSTPDQFVINKAEYRKLFPYDVYKDEDQPSTWTKEKTVFKITDSTNPSGGVKIPESKPEAGWYMLTATAVDKSGDTVRDVKYIQLTVNDVAVYPGIRATIKTDKKVAEAGEKVKYRVEGNVDELYLIQDVSAKDTMLKRSFYSKVRSTPEQEITLTAAEKGGVLIQVVFVKHNRIFTANQRIEVPYADKELKITYETFRDKIEPGSAEKWKVKISGVKGDKVAAELLSTMYDASLDQFAPNSFNLPYIWPAYYGSERWNSTTFQAVSSTSHNPEREWKSVDKQYDELLSRAADVVVMGYADQNKLTIRGVNSEAAKRSGAPGAAPVAETRAKELMESNVAIAGQQAVSDDGIVAPPVPKGNEMPATTRTNLSELAFFITDLTTDKDGNIEFSFTAPEALTRWKWMSFAHTKDLAFGYNETSIVTKKELMIQPNATRFVRQGDRFDFSGKVTNLTDKEITGQVELQLIDPTTGASVDGWFKNVFPNQFFTAPANQSVPVSFTMEIPYIYSKALTYKMTVRGNDKADGEQGTLPVLSNRILVTESMPFAMRGAGTKKYNFEKLVKSGESETITNHSLTVEYTANPAWFAVQSLPYLADYPRESADQAFNRFYAFSIAATVAKASPAIRKIADTWKNSDSAALLSQLQKNDELKNVLLAETPWVLQANTEAEQRKQLALLFDLVRVQNEQRNSLAKLKALQSPNGGFVWFPGGPDDRYITQYILTGIGHLMKLDPASKADKELQQIVTKALAYLDKRVQESYEQIVKLTKKGAVPDGGLGNYEIQYLYLRGYFRNYPVPGSVLKAYSYYRAQSQKNWLKQSRYMQAMIALSLQATDDVKTALAIVNSLKQNAVINEELGMYWKDNRSGYYWHEAPVEAQAVLIEAFAEITKDVKSVNAMKTWLLKQKQTQSWQTTRSTADACYALFIDPTSKNSGIQDLLLNTPTVTLKLGSETLSTTPASGGTTKTVTNPSAGTGYFKKSWTEQNVQPAMGNIEVAVTNAKETSLPTWGAVYWQYFENMESVTSANTSLNIAKKLFIEKNSDRGPVLTPITAESPLKIGDKVKVRIEIRNNRDMEYVQLKDMRAAGFEPINVLSSYKYQDGLGYYETTGDASTNFYFSRLQKGTFVFEYAVFVTHNGKFNNGITNIQSLYAPEFTAHSEGLIINVEP